MRDEVGMGKTIDVILYRGQLKIGDSIMLAGIDGAFTTHIKGLKRPQGMAEMRDAGKRWVNFDSCRGCMRCQNSCTETGSNHCWYQRLHLANTAEERDRLLKKRYVANGEMHLRCTCQSCVLRATKFSPVKIISRPHVYRRMPWSRRRTQGCGHQGRHRWVVGSAWLLNSHQLKHPVRQATVGPVNKRDILMAQIGQDPLQQGHPRFFNQSEQRSCSTVGRMMILK